MYLTIKAAWKYLYVLYITKCIIYMTLSITKKKIFSIHNIATCIQIQLDIPQNPTINYFEFQSLLFAMFNLWSKLLKMN